MIKLGFMIDNLGTNQLANSLINSGNSFLKNNSQSDLIIFRQNIMPNCVQPNFGIMDTAEAYNYDGVVVATSLSTADYLIRCPGPCKKLYYIWDLEWVSHSQKIYEIFEAVYNSTELEIVCRSEEHAHFVNTCWNKRDIKIIEDADVSLFYDYVSVEKPVKTRPRTFVEGLFYAKR
jgi:hypothetical protein